MRNIFLIGGTYFIFIFNIFAQSKPIEIALSIGMRGEILYKTDIVHNYRTGQQISAPAIGFGLSYYFTPNWTIKTGFSIVEHQTNWSIKNNTQFVKMNQKLFFFALEIPVIVQYNLFTKNKHWHFSPHIGLQLLIPIKQITEDRYYYPKIDNDYNYKYIIQSNNRKYGLLINTGIACKYQFQFGLGIGLSVDYHLGCSKMNQLKFTQIDKNDVFKTSKLYYKGDYWQTAISISYIWHQISEN